MSEMRCKQCGANEDRINGLCSVECEEYYHLEEEIVPVSKNLVKEEPNVRI